MIMIKKQSGRVLLQFAAVCVIAVMMTSSWQTEAVIPAAGKVVLVTGKAAALTPDGKPRKLKRGGPFYEGDTIETQKKSFVKLKYTDGGVMLLRPATKLVVEKYKNPKKGKGESVSRLVKGGLRAVTGAIAKRDRSKFKLKTPTATMGVRGTDFTVRFCAGDCGDLGARVAPPADGLYTGVNSGGIDLTNAAGTRGYNAGQYGYVKNVNTRPQVLPAAPAVIAVDDLPPPTQESTGESIEGNACK